MTVGFSVITILILQALLLVPTQNRERQKVPDDFGYPESMTYQFEDVIRSKSISGIITYTSGDAASDVLVEILEEDWGKRIEAILTDSKGHFAFAGNTPGVYFLKISKPGFNSMLLKIEVTTKRARPGLKIGLLLST
jgi:hypothetical protein